jgi:tRNA/tmRNA/rRNA uracil-C5-methylase (TrmA/RlmC/RlmD family)
VIVCDPPRKGMERSVVKAIRQSGADKVVLISCNPATLARDLGLLCGTLREDASGQITKSIPHPNNKAAILADVNDNKNTTVANVNDNDYKIISITPYDMFPQTKHCEVLVSLNRK